MHQYFFSGGYTNASLLLSTKIINIATDTGSWGPDLPAPSHKHCSMMRKSTGILYIIGGKDLALLDTALSYDTSTGASFQLLAGSMNTARMLMVCLMKDQEGKIVVA